MSFFFSIFAALLNAYDLIQKIEEYCYVFLNTTCQAANPGCILEDFVRWHSPPDWTENDLSDESKDASFGCGDPLSSRGHLSSRMKKEGEHIEIFIVMLFLLFVLLK